jgi:Mrp family chromosome partitioning ATPase
MSRHLEILRRASLEGELFAATIDAGNGAAVTPAAAPAPRLAWGHGAGRDQWQQLAYELFLKNGVPRCVGLAAATAGEGASFAAAHLAAAVVKATERPTLLVETNLHRPAQAACHGVEPDPGLRHLLLDREFPLDACLRQTAMENLWLLPAGSAPEGFTAPPDWAHFAPVFEALRLRFGMMVVDLPPVNVSTDAALVGPLLDAVVLVVEADLCSREVIQNAAARLRRANPNLAGAILNKRKFFVPPAIYRRL